MLGARVRVGRGKKRGSADCVLFVEGKPWPELVGGRIGRVPL